MSSKLISDLAEELRGMATVHKQLCEEAGIELLIYCTKRSNQEQIALYASGRTAKGKIVTNARAGESAHNPDKDGYAHAYDCCPMVSGKPIWDTSDPKWAIVGKYGEEAGLLWSGRWTGSLKETAHFQDSKWKKETTK